MHREINIESIRILEEEITEHERAAVKLKRARNSLLNVSKLPPEVLGNIFGWNVALKGDFDGLEKESHNFLLVCHHWFEVASRTPELWAFWSNSPKDWARWHRRSGNAPLDLVLSGCGYDKRYFDDALCDTLEDHAAKDTIRRVHLSTGHTGFVGSILDSLTLDFEGVRPNSIKSLILENLSKGPMDVSDFFAHHRFPKLQRLKFRNCSISSWDHLTSRTSALTTLELDLNIPSPIPTTSQSLSILSSNPALRKVALLRRAVPDDRDGKSFPRVQLHQLKDLRLDGDVRCVLNLLHQLDHPRNMDILTLTLRNCDDMDVSQVVGPYLRDHLQRRDRNQNGLSFFVSSGYRTHRAPHVTLRIGNAGGINFSDPPELQIGTFVDITTLLNGKPHDVRERVVLGLVACIPREEVVYFNTQSNPVATVDPCTQFPNIRALSFNCVSLSAAFPGPGMAGEGEIFAPLEYVLLENVDDEDDWSPLVTFLVSRASSGNRLDTLVIGDSCDTPQEVVEAIRDTVRELRIGHHNSQLRLPEVGPNALYPQTLLDPVPREHMGYVYLLTSSPLSPPRLSPDKTMPL